MEKQLVSFDKSNYEQKERDIKAKAEILQSFVDDFHKLNIGDLEGDDLILLFTDTVNLFTNKLTKGEELKIAGIPTNVEKVFEIIQKPKGTDELVKKVISFYGNRFNRENCAITNYTIVSKKVSITQSTENKLKEQCSVYIENDNQKEVLEILTDLTSALNRLKSKTNNYLAFETIEEKFIKRKANPDGNNNTWDFTIKTESLKKF
ncbi:hypothetical protein [Flavobacterium johnsoniae]|uniref:Uncharacterized protein n=1 Tax=Flavobacterium johnsoniae TaxID=986 RepID=A0A1M5IZE5_FLAJO|nr:hypothetical protein [Flavobacterium johnsoniae]SHG33133.1 hypothetical protein SAMN05444388_102298 [Flavobacterium johnsoniae]